MTEERIKELELLVNSYRGGVGNGGLVRAADELAKELRSTRQAWARVEAEAQGLRETIDSISNLAVSVGFGR